MRLLVTAAAALWVVLSAAAEAVPRLDCVLEGWEPIGPGQIAVHVRLPAGLSEAPVLEIEDAEGHKARQACEGEGSLCVVFDGFAGEPILATLDPDRRLADPDRFNNHFPRKLLVTPWPLAAPDAYVLRYFPGLTFKQGQAPVRPLDSPLQPPAPGPMALGIGLEGQRVGEHGWQVLANLAPSLGPALDPRLSVHAYMLPHPNWGLDGDVGVDLHGRLSAEVATSWLLRDSALLEGFPAQQLRFALGSQAPIGSEVGAYPYGQLALFRDDSAAWGLWSAWSLFGGLDGAWRASSEAQASAPLTEASLLRLSGAIGTSGGPLRPSNRLGAGLMSQGWLSATGRGMGRATLAWPLAQRLAWPIAGLSTLQQLEAGLFVEGALLRGADAPGKEGWLAGAGAELVVVQQTVLGLPLALALGYAMPAWEGAGPVSPWPGRFYLMTTTAAFPVPDAR